MLCDICGRKNQDNTMVCIYCGSTLKKNENDVPYFEYSDSDLSFSNPDSNYIKAEVRKQPPEPNEVVISQNEDTTFHQFVKESISYIFKKIGKKKLVLLLSAMVTIVTIILSTNFILHKVSENKLILEEKEAIEVYNDFENQETFVYNSSGELLQKLNDNALPVWYSQNYSSVILRSQTNNSLYYVNQDKKMLFNSEVYSMDISDDGKLLYSANNSEGNQLRLLDIESQVEKVMEEDENLYYTSVSISPDGQSYAYSKVPHMNIYTKCETFIKINGGEPTSMGEGTVIFVISDNGSYVYFVKALDTGEFEYYVKGDGEPVLLSKEIRSSAFNQDYSEIIFTDSQGTYLCSKGEETIKVSDIALSEIITPIKGPKKLLSGVVVYPIVSFKNNVIVGPDNTLHYIDDNYQAKPLDTLINVANITISQDCNEIIYINAMSELTKIKDLSGKKNKVILANNVKEFAASKDLKQFYYLKEMDITKDSDEVQLLINQPEPKVFPLYELYYKRDNEEPVMISSLVSVYQLNAIGDIAFFLKLDAGYKFHLYSSTKGGDATLVEEFDAVDSLEKWNYGIVVKEKIDDRVNIFYNTGKKDFILLLENVMESIRRLKLKQFNK